MNEEIRNQRLGNAVAWGLKDESIQDMLFIFDDDGFVAKISTVSLGQG